MLRNRFSDDELDQEAGEAYWDTMWNEAAEAEEEDDE